VQSAIAPDRPMAIINPSSSSAAVLSILCIIALLLVVSTNSSPFRPFRANTDPHAEFDNCATRGECGGGGDTAFDPRSDLFSMSFGTFFGDNRRIATAPQKVSSESEGGGKEHQLFPSFCGRRPVILRVRLKRNNVIFKYRFLLIIYGYIHCPSLHGITPQSRHYIPNPFYVILVPVPAYCRWTNCRGRRLSLAGAADPGAVGQDGVSVRGTYSTICHTCHI
jgi:hypothetical protein